MKSDCIFCKIANKEIKSEIVYEDKDMLAFKDIDPKAPVHFLFIPKKHITTLNDILPEDGALLGNMFLKMKETALKHGISSDGYRIVANCNKNGGQAVLHLHFHLLGGRSLAWPPG
ncbi:MAG TPA: histidine triad nucleotide-binding protein [Candidatus Omnitrophota bacterium]|nr:histidine triad nucleotide-binding protein [Candidatus Omnitrophota bacterium]HPS20831.1 histidine triad nucleotide-binding protein [Candidatus Omnitrophota bacterium]